MVPRAIRIALAASVLFAFLGAGFWIHAFIFTRSPLAQSTAGPAPNAAEALQSAFVSVAERVRPAVVHIGTVQVAKMRRPPASPGPFADDPLLKDFFDQFFGPRGPGRREEFHTPGLGSGVIIDKRGYVLTNHHVVRGADGVTVRLSSKQEYRGRIVGVEVNGINTAIVATGQGIGFAIPANMVKRVTGQLIDRGKVTRGWIGIAMEPLTNELAQSFGLHDTRGAVVARVYPGGPAAAAGLQKNDVVVSFEGIAVEDYRQLQRLSADAEVGRTVKLEVVRNRERRAVELRVAEAPDRLTPERPASPSER